MHLKTTQLNARLINDYSILNFFQTNVFLFNRLKKHIYCIHLTWFKLWANLAVVFDRMVAMEIRMTSAHAHPSGSRMSCWVDLCPPHPPPPQWPWPWVCWPGTSHCRIDWTAGTPEPLGVRHSWRTRCHRGVRPPAPRAAAPTSIPDITTRFLHYLKKLSC